MLFHVKCNELVNRVFSPDATVNTFNHDVAHLRIFDPCAKICEGAEIGPVELDKSMLHQQLLIKVRQHKTRSVKLHLTYCISLECSVSCP